MGKFWDWLTADQAPAQRAEQTPASDPSTAVVPPARTAARGSVGVGEALGLSMVYRAVSILTTSAKQLSLDVYRYEQKLPRPRLIDKPSIDYTRSAFLETSIVSLATNGNAYWRKIFKAGGREVSSLRPLNPLDVQIQHEPDGTVTGYSYRGQDLAVADVQHLALLRVPGTPYGLGPIQACRAEIRGALDQRDYAAGWFDQGGQPNGILKADGHLTEEQAKTAKAQWNATAGAKKGVAVLPAGLTYTPIYMSPKDVQFIEGQQFSTTQIARLFGVPASLMLAAVEGGSQTYANVEQDWLGYVRFGLMQYLIEIEDSLSELLPGAQRAKFNIDALLRADTTTRYGAHAVALAAGFKTVGEVRRDEGLPPLADEDAAAAPAADEGNEE